MPVIDDNVDVDGQDPEDAIEAARLADEQGSSTPASESDESVEAAPAAEEAPEGAADEAAGAEAEAAPEAAPAGKKAPESIPYGRFKEVVDDKNELKRQLAEAKAALAAGNAAPAASAPETQLPSQNGAVDFLRQAMNPLLQEYLAPVIAQAEESKRQAFKAQHAGRVDDDVIELALTKFELAKRAGMVQRNADGSPTLTPEDVLAAEVGRLFMSGVNVSHARAAASRAAVQQVNKAAVTPTRGRGRTEAPKFNPHDPNVDADALMKYARENDLEF